MTPSLKKRASLVRNERRSWPGCFDGMRGMYRIPVDEGGSGLAEYPCRNHPAHDPGLAALTQTGVENRTNQFDVAAAHEELILAAILFKLDRILE